jgi:hypothetical protein
MLKNALILLLASIPFVSSAQRDKDSTTNRQVVIEAIYKPKFMDVQKIESVPVIDKPQIKASVFTYQIKAHQVNTEKIVNPMPVADLIVNNESVYPNSFIKLGYGNIRTPLAEIFLNNKQNKKYSYGAHYRFLQTNSNLNNSFADFSNHNFKGYASTYTENSELGIDVNYRQNKFYYYGYDTSSKKLEVSTKNLSRTINTFDARAYFNSTASSKKKLKHRSQFNYYNFGIDKALENQYAFNTKLYGNIPNFNELKNCQLSAVLGVDYNTFKWDSLSSIKRLFIQIDPRFEFEYEGLQITAGFNTSIFINGKDSAVPYFNPVIKVNYPLIEGVANLYAGIDGRYQKQSLRNIINTNPFTSQYELSNMYENLKSYLGINAKMGASADAMFEIAYSDVSKMPLFVTRKDSNFAVNSFSILYTQVSLLKFTAAFNYSLSEKVRIGVLGNFYNYEITEQAYPWQLPNLDAKMNMRFNIKNKLYPHIDIMAFGAQKQKTMDINTKINTSNSIEAFYDISMGIDYRFKNKLSAFVQANNLLNNRYQRWYNYPVYGFNIIGGITMIF